MNRPQTTRDYQQRVNKVLEYINNHLSDELDVEKLAVISNFSMFHFHRIMRAYLNEPLWNFITRLRLDTAARLLEVTRDPVNEIADQVGYSSPSSFNKAFKSRFNLTPVEFRQNRTDLSSFSKNLFNSQKSEIMLNLKPKVKEIPPMKVIYIQCIEPYGGKKMEDSWGKLFQFVKSKSIFSFGMACYGISYDDPGITEPEKCRYDSCVTIKKEVKPEGEIGVKEIGGGKYAIFSYKGPYSNLDEVYDRIHREWLPDSKFELRDAPCMEKYLNTPQHHKPEDLRTNIYIPVK
jgi:AraC family transcriptional regulator